MLRAVRRTGVPVLVGHHRRHNPRIKAVRDSVAGGQIGRLTAVVGLWMLRKPDDYFDVAWRREAGGGPILINLIHDIDNLRFVCGEIAEVQALTSNAARGFPVEDTAALLLRFANGALGTVTVSDATPAPWSWELASGENAAYPKQDAALLPVRRHRGLAVRSRPWSCGPIPARADGMRRWHAPNSPSAAFDPLVEQLRHFLAVIARRETPLISVEDAMGTLAVVEAVKEAARTGTRISPNQLLEQAA